MTSWMLSILVSVVVAVLWHGLSLKLAIALAGEESPSFMRTAWISWLGGLASGFVGVVWAWTLGMAVSMIAGAWVSAAVGLMLGVLTAAAVYKRGLKMTGPTSLGVAGIHAVLIVAVNSMLAWFVHASFY